MTTRTKTKKPAKWRYLKRRQIVRPGDQIKSIFGEWISVQHTIGSRATTLNERCKTFRRLATRKTKSTK